MLEGSFASSYQKHLLTNPSTSASNNSSLPRYSHQAVNYQGESVTTASNGFPLNTTSSSSIFPNAAHLNISPSLSSTTSYQPLSNPQIAQYLTSTNYLSSSRPTSPTSLVPFSSCLTTSSSTLQSRLLSSYHPRFFPSPVNECSLKVPIPAVSSTVAPDLNATSSDHPCQNSSVPGSRRETAGESKLLRSETRSGKMRSITAFKFHKKPVRLLCLDPSTLKITLNQDTLKMIRNVSQKLSIVCILGGSRKSHFINRLLGIGKQGFKDEPSFGINMWGQPVNLETTDGRYALFLNCTGFTINNFHKKSKYFIASNQLLSIAASLSSIFLIISSQYELVPFLDLCSNLSHSHLSNSMMPNFFFIVHDINLSKYQSNQSTSCNTTPSQLVQHLLDKYCEKNQSFQSLLFKDIQGIGLPPENDPSFAGMFRELLHSFFSTVAMRGKTLVGATSNDCSIVDGETFVEFLISLISTYKKEIIHFSHTAQQSSSHQDGLPSDFQSIQIASPVSIPTSVSSITAPPSSSRSDIAQPLHASEILPSGMDTSVSVFSTKNIEQAKEQYWSFVTSQIELTQLSDEELNLIHLGACRSALFNLPTTSRKSEQINLLQLWFGEQYIHLFHANLRHRRLEMFDAIRKKLKNLKSREIVTVELWMHEISHVLNSGEGNDQPRFGTNMIADEEQEIKTIISSILENSMWSLCEWGNEKNRRLEEAESRVLMCRQQHQFQQQELQGLKESEIMLLEEQLCQTKQEIEELEKENNKLRSSLQTKMAASGEQIASLLSVLNSTDESTLKWDQTTVNANAPKTNALGGIRRCLPGTPKSSNRLIQSKLDEVTKQLKTIRKKVDAFLVLRRKSEEENYINRSHPDEVRTKLHQGCSSAQELNELKRSSLRSTIAEKHRIECELARVTEHRDTLQKTISELTLQNELQGRDLRDAEEFNQKLKMELTAVREREMRLERHYDTLLTLLQDSRFGSGSQLNDRNHLIHESDHPLISGPPLTFR